MPPRSQHPPSQHNTRPAPSPPPRRPALRCPRRPPPKERPAPPATQPLPPGAPRHRAFGLRAQRCPGYRTVYPDGVGPTASDARRRRPARATRYRSRALHPPAPGVRRGFAAAPSRSAALAPHCLRFAHAVHPPNSPRVSTSETGYLLRLAYRPAAGAVTDRFARPRPAPPPAAGAPELFLRSSHSGRARSLLGYDQDPPRTQRRGLSPAPPPCRSGRPLEISTGK